MKPLVLAFVFLVISCTANQVNNGLQKEEDSSNVDALRQCEYNCLGDSPCLSHCLSLYGQSQQNAKLIGISIGALSLLIILAMLLVICCFFPCICCPCHPYQIFKKRYNQIYDQSTTDRDYQNYKNQIMNFLNVTEQKGIFCFTLAGNPITSRCKAKVISEYKLKTKIKAWGCDDGFGQWIAHGYILMKKQGITLWLYKIYTDKKKALLGKCTDIILISTKIEGDKEIKGTWQNAKEKRRTEDNLLAGSWQITLKQAYTVVQSVQQKISSNLLSAEKL